MAFVNDSFAARRSGLIMAGILVVLAHAVLTSAATYPDPVLSNTSAYGEKIPRTMNLIATSTASHRNTVRIQVYGQSWEKQNWCQQLATWLKATYPNVNFIFKNNAIGGFASNQLQYPATLDIHPFYPDLLIFHVGMTDAASFQSILTTARQNTACELMLIDGFYPIGNTWEAGQITSMAPTFHAELVDAYNQFQAYATQIGDPAGDLLKDSTGHISDQGNFLLAKLLEAHFVYQAASTPDPDSLGWTYHVGTDASFVNGRLTLPFAGNRVDLIAADPNVQTPVSGKILIDGKAPSTYSGCYTITRPDGQKAEDWINGPVLPDRSDTIDWPWNGAITRVRWNAPLVLETWTATIQNGNMAANPVTFNFAISGSVTGADGSGASGQNFTSSSGRVVIASTDWFMYSNSTNPDHYVMPDNFSMSWQVVPMFKDTFTAPNITDPTLEYATTVAQCFPNGNHTLEIDADGAGSVPISAIRIYRPLVGRPATTVAPPLSVVRAPRAGVSMEGNLSAGSRVSVFDLRGRSISKGLLSTAEFNPGLVRRDGVAIEVQEGAATQKVMLLR